MEPEYHKCATVASLGARSVRWVERGETSSREIVPVPAARRAKIFLGAAPIDSLTIQRLGPNFQCTLVGHGGRNDTTGSKGRDDCCVARSDRSIAASTRTVRRARPSAGRISEAGPQLGRPRRALLPFLLHYSRAATRLVAR